MILGTRGDELEDLRLGLSGFDTVGALVKEGECNGEVRGKGNVLGDRS
jgi:hypothetical protein